MVYTYRAQDYPNAEASIGDTETYPPCLGGGGEATVSDKRQIIQL